jgi:hypothetical protein
MDTEYAFTVRGEAKLTGDWTQYVDWQAWPDKPTLAVFGAAVHVQESEYGTPVTTESFAVEWTVDFLLKYRGWSFFAAGLGVHTDTDTTDSDRYGLAVQTGYFILTPVELLARYEWATGPDELSIITLGFNYFLQGHRLKITGDVGYALDRINAAYFSDPLGWRLDAPGEEGQIVTRLQAQLIF